MSFGYGSCAEIMSVKNNQLWESAAGSIYAEQQAHGCIFQKLFLN